MFAVPKMTCLKVLYRKMTNLKRKMINDTTGLLQILSQKFEAYIFSLFDLHEIFVNNVEINITSSKHAMILMFDL